MPAITRIDIAAKLDIVKSNLKQKIKDAIKGVGGGEAEAPEKKKDDKNGTNILSNLLKGIITKLGPLAILLKLQPVADLIEILVSFVGLGILLIIKWLKAIIPVMLTLGKLVWEKLKVGFEWLKEASVKLGIWIGTKLAEGTKWLIEKLKALPGWIWNKLVIGFNWLKEKLAIVKEAIKTAIDWLGGKLKNFFTGLKEKLILIKEKVIDLKNKIISKWNEIKEKFLAKLSELKEKFETIKTTIKEKLELLKEKLETLKTKLATLLNNLPQKIWDKIKDLASMIAAAIKGLLPGRSRDKEADEEADDAIITKGGKVIKLNPQDDIIASKNGFGGVGGGTKIFNFYGVTSQEMLDTIKRELSTDVFNSSRF